jgi:hypothetical protein
VAPGLENQINGRGDPLGSPRDTLNPQKLALISPTSGGRWVGILIVRLRTKATEFSFFSLYMCVCKSYFEFCSFGERFMISVATGLRSLKDATSDSGPTLVMDVYL